MAGAGLRPRNDDRATRAAFGEPTLVKVDDEGFEAEVLAGATCPPQTVTLDELERLGDYRYAHTFAEERVLRGPFTDRLHLLVDLRALGEAYGDIVAARR
jgi:hypothetical protein